MASELSNVVDFNVFTSQSPILPRKISTRKVSIGGSKYAPVKTSSDTGGHRGRADLTAPFRDFDSSSDDEELLRKPYTDNVDA